jgi:aryl-alcohol dehydrogenase-like predicted oxidoreductase
MECIRICDKYGLPRPIVEQPQYNMLTRERIERDYVPLYDEFGLGTTTWSPMAGGLLSGKYNDGVVPVDSRYATVQLEFIQKRFRALFSEE